MADRYPYPAGLDSDDEGSVEYDWDEDDNQLVDDTFDDDDSDDSLAQYVHSMNLGGAQSTPPPSYRTATNSSRPPGYSPSAGPKCVVCKIKPQFNQNGRTYPTCGLTCGRKLQLITGTIQQPQPSTPRSRNRRQYTVHGSQRSQRSQRSTYGTVVPVKPPCVICKQKPSYGEYLTCGYTCAEKLCKDGGDPNTCDYCHKAPRLAGQTQCGQVCADKAKMACLLCKCRPRNGRYHFCGKTCKRVATKSTPLILEAPRGHSTFDMVEKKFIGGWKQGSPNALPTIKKVYKIIENDEFLRPYDKYRKAVGNEHFRYHGTGRQCQLGATTTSLCSSATCSLCNILKTSFKVSLAKTSGAFGAGVYSSSAANKAFSYCGAGGAMLLTKVVLGKIRTVTGWNEVMACPPGFDSVVFDRMNGNLNETIVYSDDAIRPVFLITF